ncbi:MAG: phosphotransferase [Candidatus Calescibacterium sp.]|nr:phosphotransferase [Candidatus Calescibacterium sp.]MCX7972600.1 phosphotransferase [bacterium]MDW8195765.1 phosphotransferase [Candidatus Calescibacterium sp.]
MKIINSGSERNFIILKRKVILIDNNQESLKKYVFVSKFLKDNRINVPRIYEIFPNFVILQNLGDNLYSLIRKKPRNNRWLLEKYSKIINEIIKIHSLDMYYGKGFNFFDLRVLRWEWKYFIENYLLNYLGYRFVDRWYYFLEIVVNTCYNVYRNYRSLIHRDLQSTNVIFYKRKPYLIDFQGMMVGNFLYDLASLLEDPYVNLPDFLKERLIYLYFQKSLFSSSLSLLYKYYKVQRLVQVLGAFSFLSIHKNKEFFIDKLRNSFNVYRSIVQELKNL